MRDPRRIDDVVLAIAEVWAQSPDLRLGQLLVWAVRPVGPCPELFFVEDAELVRRVRAEGRRLQDAERSTHGDPADGDVSTASGEPEASAPGVFSARGTEDSGR